MPKPILTSAMMDIARRNLAVWELNLFLELNSMKTKKMTNEQKINCVLLGFKAIYFGIDIEADGQFGYSARDIARNFEDLTNSKEGGGFSEDEKNIALVGLSVFNLAIVLNGVIGDEAKKAINGFAKLDPDYEDEKLD